MFCNLGVWNLASVSRTLDLSALPALESRMSQRYRPLVKYRPNRDEQFINSELPVVSSGGRVTRAVLDDAGQRGLVIQPRNKKALDSSRLPAGRGGSSKAGLSSPNPRASAATLR